MLRMSDMKRSSAVDPTTVADVRRTNKPLMEKRRRARINLSLQALKAILVNTKNLVKADGNLKYAKLEKADILEKTVRHFQLLRTFDQPELDKYSSGFSDCIKEVSRYLNTPDVYTGGNIDLTNHVVREKMIKHLNNCVEEIRANGNVKEMPDNVIDNLLNNEENLYTNNNIFDVAAPKNIFATDDFINQGLIDASENPYKREFLSPPDYTLSDKVDVMDDDVNSFDNMDIFKHEINSNDLELTSIVNSNLVPNSNSRQYNNAMNVTLSRETCLIPEPIEQEPLIQTKTNNNYLIGSLNSHTLPQIALNGNLQFIFPAKPKIEPNTLSDFAENHKQLLKMNDADKINNDDTAINFEEVLKTTWNIEQNCTPSTARYDFVKKDELTFNDEPLDYSCTSLNDNKTALCASTSGGRNVAWDEHYENNDPMWRPW